MADWIREEPAGWESKKKKKKRFMAAAILEKRERELAGEKERGRGSTVASYLLASDSLAFAISFQSDVSGAGAPRSSLSRFSVKGKIVSSNQIFLCAQLCVCCVSVCIFWKADAPPSLLRNLVLFFTQKN